MAQNSLTDPRWQLYRVLSEPLRLRLLALAEQEEISVGELAELLGEGQPNISRHAAALGQSGILLDRRQGTRTLVGLGEAACAAVVVAVALEAGKPLCQQDGTLERVASVVRACDGRSCSATRAEGFAEPRRVSLDRNTL